MIETHKRKTKIEDQISYFNISPKRKIKNGNDLEFCCPKSWENKKNENRRSNSIIIVLRKRKTKTKSQIPFSNDVGKRKTKLEVQIPFSYFAGKRLALRYTHCLSSRKRPTPVSEYLSLPFLNGRLRKV